jgi:hypothetical protein
MPVTARAACLALPLAVVCCRIERSASGRPAAARDAASAAAPDSAAIAEVDLALRRYYARFSARAWPLWSRSFWPGAVITTRWIPPGDTAVRVHAVTVSEFVRRAPEGPGRLAVFSEEPVRSDIAIYEDLASAWVLYRARFGATPDSVTTHHGIDAFQLLKHAGEWRITSLTFTREVAERPLLPRRP